MILQLAIVYCIIGKYINVLHFHNICQAKYAICRILIIICMDMDKNIYPGVVVIKTGVLNS